jgi:hypothetical protein
MMLWNVSEGPAQDKAGLISTKGHSQKQVMFARRIFKPKRHLEDAC